MARTAAREHLLEGARLRVGIGVVGQHRLGRAQPERAEVLERALEHGRRGGAVFGLVLFDVGIARAIVDDAVQIDKAEPVAGLIAGL